VGKHRATVALTEEWLDLGRVADGFAGAGRGHADLLF
jgi:hypothetical protein